MAATHRDHERAAADSARTVHAFCLSILEGGRLEDKLRPPAPRLPDPPAAPLFVDTPARERDLAPSPGAGALPAAGELRSAAARVRCLQRFAHHELMAIELFAWALLAWPAAPPRLRRGWLAVLADEQRHLRLYLDRLAELGAGIGRASSSDYFWRHVPAVRDSEHGVRAFLAAMGLTYEQANLDFAGTWARAFRHAGDERSAALLERVQRDEIRHVRLAARWLRRLEEPGVDAVTAYERAVPFPLGAARAKGKQFDAAARRRAGLDESLIRHVQQARPGEHTFRATAGTERAPAVTGAMLWPNVGGEEAARDAPASSGPGLRVARLWALLYRRGTRLVVGADGSGAGAGGTGREEQVSLPADMTAGDAPVWRGLEDEGGAVAWWPSAAAVAALAARGTPLVGGAPGAARQVHDKAFTVDEAARLGHLPAELTPLIAVLSPEELRAGDALQRLDHRVAGWPAWTAGRFTLKPRLGTSGRGRAGGVAGRLDQRVAGALERLAAGGGAILEPWLTRTGDHSVQMLVDADAAAGVTVLGTTRQLLRPSGTVIGNRGILDDDGNAHAGTRHDDALTRAAVALAGAAAARGFTGPCGIDAFTYVGPEGVERLRPLVELNARPTTGLIALGLLRRALAAGRTADAQAWAFLLRSPAELALHTLPGGVRCVPVPEHPRARHPAVLLLAADVGALDEALDGLLGGIGPGRPDASPGQGRA